jgi:hypothetical protein
MNLIPLLRTALTAAAKAAATSPYRNEWARIAVPLGLAVLAGAWYLA